MQSSVTVSPSGSGRRPRAGRRREHLVPFNRVSLIVQPVGLAALVGDLEVLDGQVWLTGSAPSVQPSAYSNPATSNASPSVILSGLLGPPSVSSLTALSTSLPTKATTAKQPPTKSRNSTAKTIRMLRAMWLFLTGCVGRARLAEVG